MITPSGRHTVFFLISILVLMFLATPSTSPAKEYRVTNANDSGPGSLNQVIEDLNASGDEEGNKIVFAIPREPGSTEPPTLDVSLPEIKKPVKFENAPGQDVKLNSSRIRPFYAYGIYADKGFAMDTVSGDVSGMGIGLFYGNAYGIYSGDTITIGSLSGHVSGLGAAAGLFGAYGTGYGLYAEKDILVDNLSGTVTGTGGSGALGAVVAGAYASGYGMHAGKNITIGTVSGAVAGSGTGVGAGAGMFGFTGAYASGYGMYAGENITIGTLSGDVSGTGTAVGLAINFGRKRLYDRFGSAPDSSVATDPWHVLGLGFTGAYASGYGLFAGKDIGIGTLSGNVSGSGNAVGLGIAIGRGQLFKGGGAAGAEFSGSFASGYGAFAGNDIRINILEGNVRGDGMAIGFGAAAGYLRYSDRITGAGLGFNGSYGSGYGLYAGNDIVVGTLSGTVAGTGTTVGVGLRIGSGTSGYTWGTKGYAVGMGFTGAYGSGYGLYANNNIVVGTLSGNVNGTGTSVGLGFDFGRGTNLVGDSYDRDTVAGSGAGFTGSYGSGYGLYAGKDMTIRTVSGIVNGTGNAIGLDIGIGSGEGRHTEVAVGAGFTGAYGSGYGLWSGNDMTIGTLSGTVTGTGTAVTAGFGLRTPDEYNTTGVGLGFNGAFGSGYGLYAGRDVKIDTFSGKATGTGSGVGLGMGITPPYDEHERGVTGFGVGLTGAFGSGYGVYAGRDVTIGTLSGEVGGTGTAVGFGIAVGATDKSVGIGSVGTYGSGYGVYAADNVAINNLSGYVYGTGTAVGAGFGLGFGGNATGIGGGTGFSYGSGYGVYAGKDITITSLDGYVTGTGTAGQTQAGYGEGEALGIGAAAGFSYGSGYGLYAGNTIVITSLNGYVSGTGTAFNGTLGVGTAPAVAIGAAAGLGSGSGYGLYAGRDITIGTLAGSVEGAGFAADFALAIGAASQDGVGVGVAAGLSHGSGYGLYAGNSISIGTISGNANGSGIAVGGALGIGLASVGAGVGAGSGYGLFAGQDVAIDTLSGNVTGTGFALSTGVGMGVIPAGAGVGAGYGYGIYAGKDITIDTLSGNVSGSGTDISTGVVGVGTTSGYGLYAGKDITIGTLSGTVTANGLAFGLGAGGVGTAAGYGLYAGENIKIHTLSGTVTASATAAGGAIGAGFASAYGIHAGKDISIRIMSGTIKTEPANYWIRLPGTGHNAYGIYAEGALNGGSADTPSFISGNVFAHAAGDAIAVRSDGPMNIYVIGTLSGVDTSWLRWMWNDGYAIYGGKGNDIVSLDTGAKIIGKIDLGKGRNTLNLYGSNSLDSYFKNITSLNVGNGTRGAYWSLDTGVKGSSFANASIKPYGILAVNTDVTGAVSVAGSGILTGSGTITGDVINSGILMPYNKSNPIGKNNSLTIYGNYTHNADALFMVRANAAGQADRFTVAKPHWYSRGQGVATLMGGTVSVLADTGTYEKETKYTILTANKVDGTFTKTETNLAFLDPSLAYDSQNVFLTLTRNGRAYSDVAETANQKSVARIFEKAEQDKHKVPVPQGGAAMTAMSASATNTLESLSPQGAKTSYDRLAGYNHTAAASAGFSQFNRYMDVMKERAHSFLSGNPGSTFAGLPIVGSRTDMSSSAPSMLLAQLNALDAVDQPIVPQKWGFFARGYGGFGETRQNDISSRYDQATSGFVTGFDTKLTSSLLMGATMGYSYTKLGMDAFSDTARVRGHQASVYGVYSHGPVYVNGILGYGYNDYDTTRQLAFSSSDSIAQASYAGHIASGYVETGYRFTGTYMDVIPLAGIQGSYLLRDGFSESGAETLGLSVDRQSYSSLVSSLGVRLGKKFALETGTMTPEVKLRWDHEFANDTYGMNASFTGYPGASFTVMPERPDRDRLVAGFSLIRQGAGNISLYLSYEGTFSPNETLHTGGMGLKYRW